MAFRTQYNSKVPVSQIMLIYVVTQSQMARVLLHDTVSDHREGGVGGQRIHEVCSVALPLHPLTYSRATVRLG